MLISVRISFITETWLPSINGVVTRLTATVGVLHQRGHDVMVVAPTCTGPGHPVSRPPPLPPDIEVRTVPSVGVPFLYGGQPWGLPLPRVTKLLDRFRPDVVHAVCPFLLGWAGVRYARSRGLPLVCSYHTHIARYAHFYRVGFAERPVWAVIRKAHQQADLNLAASDAARIELEQQGVRNVHVWQGGVDLDLFHPSRRLPSMRHRLTGGHPDRQVCLYVGRLAAEKGLERLIGLARDRGRHLALVGDGPARDRLMAAFAGTQSTFLGALSGVELAAAYASADVFVFPSTTDTLGLVLLEAMASGLPVVAAETPAAADMLGSSMAGSLFQADDPRVLRAAVDRWTRTPPSRMEIAAAARSNVVSWRQSTDQLVAWYVQASSQSERSTAA